MDQRERDQRERDQRKRDQRKRRRLVFGLVAVALGALPTAALATHGRVRINGSGLGYAALYSGPKLSRDELRDCVTDQDRINREAEMLDREETANAAEGSRLDQSAAEIERRDQHLDMRNRAAVDSYNELVEQHSRAAKQYNARLPGYNDRAQAHYRDVLHFNARCANKVYDKKDMRAILAPSGDVKK